MLNADVADSGHGAHIVLKAGIRDGTIGEMAFRVWGCPHLIAALELVCERLVEQSVASLENYELADITQELGIPAEKMGRILLLEDALAMLWAEGDGAPK
jgi:NifU-like protein involved in Fe-S cluster formation